MPDVVFLILVLTLWVAIGLSAVIFLGRHGRRSWHWYVIGVALGPILLPIATEIARRDGSLVKTTAGPGVASSPARLTVLVGVDGSEESDHALREAAQMFEGTGARIVLLAVIDPDLADDADSPERRHADDLLLERAAWFPPEFFTVVREVASGQPAQVILDRAAADHVDLVVVGRKGRGLSHRVLGSVADQLVRRSATPVLLGTPAARALHVEPAAQTS